MSKLKERKEGYLLDSRGRRVGVLLGTAEYHRIARDLEELESIRAYDRAKNSGGEIIPFEQAVEEIESEWE